MAPAEPDSPSRAPTTDPATLVVARVASTPDQAKVLAAILQGEGIPAHIDGQGLVDEFAISQRLMNAQSNTVLVPAGSLQLAEEILQDCHIDEEELTAQALAAAPVDAMARQHDAAPRPAAGSQDPYRLEGSPAPGRLRGWLVCSLCLVLAYWIVMSLR